MPNPLSETFSVPGIDDFDPITKTPIAVKNPLDKDLDNRVKLNAKNFLDSAVNSLSAFGRLREYGLTPPNTDDKKQVTVGPTGLMVSELGEDNDKPRWSFELNPFAKSGAFRAGNTSIGGTAGVAPSAFIQKGPLRFDYGYGSAPVPVLPGTEILQTEPGHWGKISVDFKPEIGINTPAEVSVGQAVAPFIESTQDSVPQTAREAADELIYSFRRQNPDWHRP